MIFGIAVSDVNGVLVALRHIVAAEGKARGVEMMEALFNAFLGTDGQGKRLQEQVAAIGVDLIERPTKRKAMEQRGTDAFSLVYDTEPLAEDMEILGFPRAMLTVAANATRANWFARLSDVAPDGTVTLVTGAAQNGAHRVSARDPRAIEPGKPFPLEHWLCLLRRQNRDKEKDANALRPCGVDFGVVRGIGLPLR